MPDERYVIDVLVHSIIILAPDQIQIQILIQITRL